MTYTDVLPVHTPLVTAPIHLCPYPVPKIEEIVKDIERAARRTDKHKFVSDLMECGAIAVSNLVDLPQREKREERYLQIMKSYPKEDQNALADIFAKIFALLSSAVYDDGRFDDYLGKLFMNTDLGNEHTGQFFTPYHISHFMAEATLTEELVKRRRTATRSSPSLIRAAEAEGYSLQRSKSSKAAASTMRATAIWTPPTSTFGAFT